MFWRTVLLVAGVLAGSTAVIMIKASRTHWAELSAYRLLVAGVVLLPLSVRDWRRHRGAYRAGHLWRAVLPAGLLGAHFLTWVVGARLTIAANASLIVNMVAVANLGQFVFAGAMAWGFFGERPTAALYAAAALVVGGAWLAVRFAPPGVREETRQAACETPAGK